MKKYKFIKPENITQINITDKYLLENYTYYPTKTKKSFWGKTTKIEKHFIYSDGWDKTKLSISDIEEDNSLEIHNYKIFRKVKIYINSIKEVNDVIIYFDSMKEALDWTIKFLKDNNLNDKLILIKK